MALLRQLTEEEFDKCLAMPIRGAESPSLCEIRKLQAGRGILISHEGIKCSKRNCGLAQFLVRLRKRTGLQYRGIHTNGIGSNLMVICSDTDAAKS